MKIPNKYIIKIGFFRLKNRCASCKCKMDVPIYNIQMCTKCKIKYLDKMYEAKTNGNK